MANFETNSKVARAAKEASSLEEYELIVFLGFKILYTNVPVEETIEIVHKEVFSIDDVPEIPM